MSRRKRNSASHRPSRSNLYLQADQHAERQLGTGQSPRFDRKTAQLCRQVANTLSFVLHGDGTNELLSSLTVTAVEPAPNAGRLLVVVQSDLDSQTLQPTAILELLDRQIPRLRSEIARSINRRKTPQLIFQLAARPQSEARDMRESN